MTKAKSFSYVEIMASLDEANAPPGGDRALAALVSRWPRRLRSGLDVGCNTGAYSYILADLADVAVVGVDISSAMIAAARRRPAIPGLDVSFEVGDARALPVADGSQDFVFSAGSTAFVEDREAAYREYARVLRPGGIISELNFYYEQMPPQIVFDRLHQILGFQMPRWMEEDWLASYAATGLDPLWIETTRAEQPRCSASDYVSSLLEGRSGAEPALKAYLEDCFGVFEENNCHLRVLSTIFQKPLLGPQPRFFQG